MIIVFVDNIFITFRETPEYQVGLGKSDAAKRALIFNSKTNQWENPFRQDADSTENSLTSLHIERTRMQLFDRKWVLLKNSQPEQNYEGPYSSAQIFEFLREKKISLLDPIWQDSQPKWLSIKHTETFKGLLRPREPDAAELLSAVIEYDPQMRRVEDNSSPKDSDQVFIILDDK